MSLVNVKNKIKPIAIVLPQFHPTPENNQWWGEGFTEWTNVVKGRPRFEGHYQPHLPKDLGYYDLRLPEAREAQADLAKKFGIYGFCYYHYWFNGRRVLEKPVDAILESGKPDFPFMLCWANENWSRNWDGGFDKVLLEQHYSIDDFIAHARHLVKYFSDPRYIKIDGKPVFAIYKSKVIPNIKDGLEAFRTELLKHGIDVFLCRFESFFGIEDNFEKTFPLFDAGIEFQPHSRQFDKSIIKHSTCSPKPHKLSRYMNWVTRKLRKERPERDKVFSYAHVVENDLKTDFQRGRKIFPGVCPGWDNTARRASGAMILHESSPELFRQWVAGKIKITNWDLLPENFLFVNAWNEWAEGNHLEPCERWGVDYLNALLSAIKHVDGQ